MNRWILMALLVTGVPAARAQSLSELETRFFEGLEAQHAERAVLDSLNRRLGENADAIEAQKKAAGGGQNRLQSLMSETVTLSDLAKVQRHRVQRIDQAVSQLQQGLDRAYSIAIDSLLAQKRRTDGRDVDSALSSLIEKRLVLSPAIGMLSFDPDKIRALPDAASGDVLEQRMHYETIQKTLDEVMLRRAEIQRTIGECDQLLAWREKLTNFLEDVQEQSLNSVFVGKGSALVLSGFGTVPEGVGSRIKSVSNLLGQFHVQDPIGRGIAGTGPYADRSSIAAYRQLLRDADKKLKELERDLRRKLP